MSLPTWERGLKQLLKENMNKIKLVAPYVGAWIETIALCIIVIASFVAPYVGAWIETGTPPSPNLMKICHSLRGSVD